MRAFLFVSLLVLLTSCATTVFNLNIEKKLNPSVVLATDPSNNFNTGLWARIKTNGFDLDGAYRNAHWWLVLRYPTYFLNNNDYILAKDANRFVFIQMKDSAIVKITRYKSLKKITQVKKEYNLPDTLDFQKWKD